MSLACAITQRRLFVCDSFEGLPVPEEDEKYVISGDTPEYYIWEEGEYRCHGGMEMVKKNIAESGNIDVCVFVKGYFRDSLKDLETDSIVLVFEDADLPSSVRDCLLNLWPKMQYGCKFFCHEPWSIDVVGLFYDKKWWKENLNTTPPGFWGSGSGTMVSNRYYRSIGYAIKFDAEKVKREGKKIVRMGSKGFEE